MMTQTRVRGIRDEDSGREHAPAWRVGLGSGWPDRPMVPLVLLSAAAMVAGLCLVGCGLAWLLADGPEMPARLAPLMRRVGIGMGLYAWLAGMAGWVWGRCGR